jgi:hypothetical protein
MTTGIFSSRFLVLGSQWLLLRGFGWSQGEFGNSIQHLAFLRRVLAEASGFQRTLTGVGRHGAQGVDGILHGLTALGRQASDARVQLTRLGLLVWGQVLPGFHAIKNTLLPLWRQAVETLQSILQTLLALRRQLAEIGIVIQSFLLLIERHTLILAQPLSGVMLLALVLRRTRNRLIVRMILIIGMILGRSRWIVPVILSQGHLCDPAD